MDIYNFYTGFELTSDQEQALSKIQDFLKSEKDVLILKGYAGTGKTTLLEGLVNYFKNNGRQLQVLAPTGRAAKILRDKTKEGLTIHRGIYNLNEFETINDDADDDAEKSFHYHFPIAQNDSANRICIIDEASMVSDAESNHELFTFGTNKLLSDLLTYMRLPGNSNKVIFIGDSAQLEPVTDSESKALQEEFFQTKGLGVETFEMTEVVRQSENSMLLKNVTNFRQLLKSSARNEVTLDYGPDVKNLSPYEITKKYLEEYPSPAIGDGVIINYSNRQCLGYNQSIRAELFPGKPDVSKGDLLMINKNNYNTHGVDLYNGTMAEVVSASKETETQITPVYVNEGGKRVRKKISLTFRDVQLKIPDYDKVISCKIIDTLLNSPEAGLSIDEMKALYINFNIRFNERQKTRKNQGLSTIRKGSEEFKELLENDPYFNALHVKYGYAITCHKAQGGEWDTTFVNFKNRVGLKNPHLRWSYTAMTRAKKKMYAINPPEITAMGSLHFSDYQPLNKLPKNTIQYNNVPETPYHSTDSNPTKKLKFFEIEHKLQSTAFSINRVESRDYKEMYFIEYGDDIIRIDATHNAAGIFKDFNTNIDSQIAKRLIKIVNEPYDQELVIDYAPTTNGLEKLYNKMQVYSDELEITITNVIEEVNKYYVLYYLKVGQSYASIQFYFGKNQQFSRANPKIEPDLSSEEQETFQTLIQRLS